MNYCEDPLALHAHEIGMHQIIVREIDDTVGGVKSKRRYKDDEEGRKGTLHETEN
jgi:hypothetical protein